MIDTGAAVDEDMQDLVVGCHRLLAEQRASLGTAESLTGGLLGAALTDVPGSSATYRGGVIAYTAMSKRTVLGVPVDLLERCGPVHAATVMSMAEGVRDLLQTTYGLATTGVAGPQPHGGRPVGTVYIGCARPSGCLVEECQLSGQRSMVRSEAARAALWVLRRSLEPHGTD